MRQKKTKEQKKQRKEEKGEDRPITENDLDALLSHFGQTRNLPG